MTTRSDVVFPEIRRTPFAFENLAFALVFLVAAKTAFREKVEVREGRRWEWRSVNPHASSLWLSAAKQSNFVCATMINALGLNNSLFARSENQLRSWLGNPIQTGSWDWVERKRSLNNNSVMTQWKIVNTLLMYKIIRCTQLFMF